MTNARHTSPRLHFSQFLCRRIRSSMVIKAPKSCQLSAVSYQRPAIGLKADSREPTAVRKPSSYAMKFQCGKQLPDWRVVYLSSTEALRGDALSQSNRPNAGRRLSCRQSRTETRIEAA